MSSSGLESIQPWWVVYFYDDTAHELGRMITQEPEGGSVLGARTSVAKCAYTRALQIGDERNLPPTRDRERFLCGAELDSVFSEMRRSLLSNIEVFVRTKQ